VKRILIVMMFLVLLPITIAQAEGVAPPPAATTVTGAGVKIAFLDAQKALDGAKEGIRLRQTLDEYVKARQKMIDLEEQDIKRLRDELDKQGPVLSQEAIKLKQGEFEEKVNHYRKKVSELQKEVQEKRLGALEEFNKKLEQSVKNIAEKEGYGLVLSKNGDGGAVIYGKESYDLTVKVIDQMDKLYAK
jgi:outer membrane protein